MEPIRPTPIDIPLSTAPNGDLTDAIGDFGLAVVNQERGNVVCSSFSILDAWLRVWAGAKGQTRAELDSAFALRRSSEIARESLKQITEALAALNDSARVKSASTIWIRPGYPLQLDYEASWSDATQTLDFTDATKAAQVVNQWVSDKTNGLIPEIIDARNIPPAMAMMIANAVYLKAEWSAPFSEYGTREETFWLSESEGVQVPMMVHQGFYTCVEHEAFFLVEKSYGDPNLQFVIVLPKPNRFDQIRQEIRWSAIRSFLDQATPIEVLLRLPKFKITSAPNVDDVIRARGATSVYAPNLADLSGVSPDALKPGEELCVGSTSHIARIDVDEAGTEAAAATVIAAPAGAAPGSPKAPPFKITVDRPFLFFIVERQTQTPVFSGQVTDPSS